MGHVDFGMTFWTEPSIGECHTNSPCLSKLNDDPGTPEVGRILSKYASVRFELMNVTKIGRSGSLVSI